jgi:hypothetical protein
MLKLFGALILIYIMIITIFVVLIMMVANDRQLTRRIFRQVKPCPFAKGTQYEITEQHFPTDRTVPATFMFSSCLFGKDSPKLETSYIQPYLEQIETIRLNMPEAQMRLYVTQSLKDKVIPRLVEKGVQVFVVSPDSRGFEGTLWRFFPADEDLPFMSLDMDANVIVSPELVTKIRHWLNDSQKPFFLMRHTWSSVLPITAGRLALKPHTLPFKVKERVECYCDTNFGVDEAFLNKELWPYIYKNTEQDQPVVGQECGILIGLIVLAVLVLMSLYWSFTACRTEKSKNSRKTDNPYSLR